ncbi:MAG: Mu-like prophage major head subunit gpT family protein, partial [Gemmataceae bacterium]
MKRTETNKQVLFTCAPKWLEAEAGPDGQPNGLPRFSMVAYTGGPMRLSGWRFPVVVDLAGLAIPSPSRPIRLGHDASHGVGHTDTVNVENGKLVASGVVSRDTAAAREVVASSRNGFPWQASIGAAVEEAEFIRENQTVTVNGQEFAGPLNVVRKGVLGEISFVDLGADMQTSARVAAKAPGENVEPPSNPQPPSIVTPAPTTSAVTELRDELAAETERINGIRSICGGKHPEIEVQAIRDGWSLDRCELEVLRANRPTGPNIMPSIDTTVTSNLLEAACAIVGKIGRPENHFDEETLERASKRYPRGIKFQQLLLEAAWANGYPGRLYGDPRDIMRYAFGQHVHAAFSTVNMAGILSNVANKFLLEGFFSVERTWRNITGIRNVSDFKTVTSHRLIGKDEFEKVARGGELKHGNLGEETYTNKADTYGLELLIDRYDIINDNLNAITTVPRKLGRGSGLAINDVFWSTFLNNASFFTAGNKNFISGATTALGIDGLTAAEIAFMEQVDSDGKPLGIMPAVLLVPPSLNAIGSQLFKALELRDNAPNAKYPVTNPHQGKYRVEVSRYLSNSKYTGNSQKAWYLLADANDLPVIEVAFLNGQESPTIETAEADFNKLGIQLRGYSDFGV